MNLLQVGVAGAHRHETLLRQRHHLGAAADHEIFHPGHDRVRRDVVGRDARTTEPVERHAARPNVEAGVERGHPSQVTALLTDLRTRTPYDVVNVGGVDPGAVNQRLEHGAAEVVRV